MPYPYRSPGSKPSARPKRFYNGRRRNSTARCVAEQIGVLVTEGLRCPTRELVPGYTTRPPDITLRLRPVVGRATRIADQVPRHVHGSHAEAFRGRLTTGLWSFLLRGTEEEGVRTGMPGAEQTAVVFAPRSVRVDATAVGSQTAGLVVHGVLRCTGRVGPDECSEPPS